jgi:hypothetical protein
VIAERFVVVGCGVDDVTLGFDLSGSRALEQVNALRGIATLRGKMLGRETSFGKWNHLFGRSVAFWKSDTKRLYVQAKLAPPGELCRPSEVGAAMRRLMERMAAVGITGYDVPWVTRMDVAVDATCEPSDGKLLLDALEGVPLPHGWRTASVGDPRSTVYFKARGRETVLARAYCRNLKLKEGIPYGRIRLEAEERFKPKELTVELAAWPSFPARVWRSRYGNLSGQVVRLAREVQTVEIARRVAAGELTYSQGERLSTFLDLVRLGLARSYYPKAAHADRRRLAADLGFSLNEAATQGMEVDLGELLSPYAAAVAGSAAAGMPRPEVAPPGAASGRAAA